MISLGIDVGTTHTKVLALEVSSGVTLALYSEPTPVILDLKGAARRPRDVLDVVIGLISRVVSELDTPADVVAICVASIGEEVVLLDEDRAPVGDSIAWFDPRGEEEEVEFIGGAGADVALVRCWRPHPSFSLFKLMWIRDHAPAELRRAAIWTDLGDYVLAALGGELVMDWTHASRVGAFDLLHRTWDIETIEAAHLDPGLFPRLVASGSISGTISADIAGQTGLPSGVVLVAGGHDHLCAAYGAGMRSTELFLSAGTAEAHLALLDRPLAGYAGKYGLEQGCFVDDEHYYVHLGLPSGHVFKQWRSLLYDGTDDDAMYAEIAATEPGADGATFALTSDLRHGHLDRLPFAADRATVMRAVLEGLARSSADLVSALEEVVGYRFETIVAAGHPARVPFWRALRQETYRWPMTVVTEPESAARGAAIIAASSLDARLADALIAR